MQDKQFSVSSFHRALILCVCGVFIALYLVLALNNRPAADDFEFLNNLRSNGWWNGMVVYFNTWNTRWLAILFLNTIYMFYNLAHSFFLYHIFTLICLAFAIYSFIKTSFHKIYSAPLSGRDTSFISALLLVSFFFISFDNGEIFLWINDNTMYLWSVIFILFGFAELMKNEFNSLLKIIASLAFIYIGGAFESYAVIVLLILIGYLIYELQKKTERNRKRITLLLFSIFFLIASFSIAFSGHGWRNRHDILGTPSITSALFITSKAFIKLFIRFLPPKIHWLILFFLVWMGIGSQLKGSLIPFKNFFLKLALIFLVSNFILLFPSCYLLRETPPFRVWTLNCFLVSVFIALSGLQLGNVLKVHQRKFLIISSTALAILFLLLVKIFFEQKKITALYAAAYDNRMQILIQSKTDSPQKEISLEPLPPSGMLYSAEISTDTNDFHNRHLKNYLQLNITPKKKPSGE